MNSEQKAVLRRRLAKAARRAEKDFINLYAKRDWRADVVREQWAILFQAWRDVMKFDFDKEAD